MQTRVIQMEEGKDNGILIRSVKSKPFPAKLLLILGLFLAFALTVFVISVSTINLEETEILEEITLHTRIHTYACSLIFIPQEKLCIEQCGFLRFTCLTPSTR
ncbi:unnamed protein product [Brassica rapa]|uniref:Uncharacterized protein n=1 Tax=Brassica campestris TaxID=3711 RepID=A0A8D9I738_BRACM|nr:unnamed protein product [Brassica rapa]